ncbi:MAG: hypothetical protein ABFD96_24985, partial [Armatimonadia bacterium]
MNELKEQLKTALLAARAIADAAEKANRDFTAEERAKIEGYLKEAKDLKGRIAQMDADADLRKSVAAMGEGLGIADSRG